MEIIMFIIFIVTNLFIILCMQFAYTHAYKYENGMYLNVHIPSSHKEDAEVTEIVTTGKRKMKHFQIANVIISIAICFIVFINIAVFVLVYIIWMFAYIFGIIHIPNSSHRKMYALKIQKGWIIEAQRKKVYIDTRVSAEAGATTVSYKWHALFLITELAAYIPYFMLGDTHYNILMISLFLCSVLISTLSLVFHAFINKSERHVYSMDSKLNLIVNNTMKRYKSIAMLLLSGLNAVAWIYVALYTGITGILPASSYYVYIFIQLIAVLGFFLARKVTELKSQKIQSLCTFVISLIIAATGAYFVYNGLQRLMYPLRIAYSEEYAYIIIATVFAKILMGLMYMAFNKKASSPVLKAMILDSFLDCAVTIFALMGLFLITKVNFAADGIFAIIIGTAVTVSAVKNTIEQSKFLINN